MKRTITTILLHESLRALDEKRDPEYRELRAAVHEITRYRAFEQSIKDLLATMPNGRASAHIEDALARLHADEG